MPSAIPRVKVTICRQYKTLGGYSPLVLRIFPQDAKPLAKTLGMLAQVLDQSLKSSSSFGRITLK